MHAPLLVSSSLLLIPARLALLNHCPDVALGAFVCWLTSLVNYTLYPNAGMCRTLDIVMVNAIGSWFMIDAARNARTNKHMARVCFIGVVSLIMFLGRGIRDATSQCLVHILGTWGIVLYMKGRLDQTSYCRHSSDHGSRSLHMSSEEESSRR